MKTIFINGRFLTQRVTGTQRYARELVSALDDLLVAQARGPGVVLLCPRRRFAEPFSLKAIEVRRVGTLGGHAWEQLELPRHCRGGVLFCPANTAPVLNLARKNRTVATILDISPLDTPNVFSTRFAAVYRVLMPLILRHAYRVLTISAAEGDLIAARFPASRRRLVVAPLGAISRGLQAAAEAAPPGRPGAAGEYVLFVGSRNGRKNLEGFLRAVAIVRRSRPVRAVVVGVGDASYSAVDTTLPDELVGNVEFAGYVDDPRLVRLYREALCLVYPSFREGAGLPPTEAMALGCPVVLADLPVLRERGGSAALYCDPRDPADIAKQVLRVVSDGALKARCRELGLRQAAELSWQETARTTWATLSAAAGHATDSVSGAATQRRAA